jgi:hypothetical protein
MACWHTFHVRTIHLHSPCSLSCQLLLLLVVFVAAVGCVVGVVVLWHCWPRSFGLSCRRRRCLGLRPVGCSVIPVFFSLPFPVVTNSVVSYLYTLSLPLSLLGVLPLSLSFSLACCLCCALGAVSCSRCCFPAVVLAVSPLFSCSISPGLCACWFWLLAVVSALSLSLSCLLLLEGLSFGGAKVILRTSSSWGRRETPVGHRTSDMF